MDIFQLNRSFIDFGFENPSIIKPNHYALYFFAIEHCNRLGWKKEFGLPTTMAMEAIGIKSYNTYSSTFNDLVSFGFFKCLQRSKNQYSSNIIAISNFNKALDKALDKAFIKHDTKHCLSTNESIDSIIIQINNKQLNNKTIHKLKDAIDLYLLEDNEKPTAKFNFFNSLISLGVNKQLANDWIAVRKNKKLTNTQTAFDNLKKEFDKCGKPIEKIIEKCVTESWGGFKASWDWKENNSKTLENGQKGFATNRPTS